VLAALDAMHLNHEANAAAASPLARPFWRANARNVRRLGATTFGRFGRVVVVSDEDAAALREVDPGLEPTVIPNGVATERFRPDPAVAREADLVMFSGVMDWAPNVVAAGFLAREVMPRVRAAHPRARLAIVGRSPSRAVLGLGGLPGVEVVGPVEHMRPWLSRARVYACPMIAGTGIKNKLLEALANGVPVVAAPLAIRGLEVQPGRDLLVGRDADELAAHVVRLLVDDGLARELGAAGRRYVERNHDWDAVARAYEQVYREVASSFAPA
jgi:glycosyltransferase involved in cell wall biosynthesis